MPSAMMHTASPAPGRSRARIKHRNWKLAPLKITTSYLSFYCLNIGTSIHFRSSKQVHALAFTRTVLKNVKNFRESYVFHCLVIKVVCLATACLLYHIRFTLSRTFFKFFQTFSKFRKAFPFCDCRLCSSDLITLSYLFEVVKHFFKFLFYFRNQC